MTDPTALPNFNTQGAGESLTDKILGVLGSFDFNPSIDADGDVMFTVEGQNLFVRILESDISLMRIFGQWQMTDDIPDSMEKRLTAANDVTLSLSVVKVGIARDMVFVSGEHIVTPDLDLPMVIQATVSLILQATGLWHQSVNSDGPHAADGGVPAFAMPGDEAAAAEETS